TEETFKHLLNQFDKEANKKPAEKSIIIAPVALRQAKHEHEPEFKQMLSQLSANVTQIFHKDLMGNMGNKRPINNFTDTQLTMCYDFGPVL
uniref:Uncharacterized protein n=1 Tax=Romanomermis culicivorax TaxID=13658 RepID=A0A915K5D8_ROMCU